METMTYKGPRFPFYKFKYLVKIFFKKIKTPKSIYVP